MIRGMLLAATLLFAGPSAWAVNGADPGELLKKARETYAQLADYTCLFNRKELFKGKLKEDEGMLLKYMKPDHYYLKWPSDLIEAIYVAGHNDNKMVIHGGSIFRFLRVRVAPEKALEYGRHTLVEADVGHVLALIEKNYSQSLTDGDASIAHEGAEIFDSVPTQRFRAVLPAGRGYYGHIILINLHGENGLPLRLIVYGWNGELLEHYEYTQLRLNVGLKEEDFDIKNPSYQFNKGEEVNVK